MKAYRLYALTFLVLVSSITLLVGCKYDVAEPMWDKPPSTTIEATIDSIKPAQPGPGVSIITIYGKNFQTVLDSVEVLFGGTEVKILNVQTDSIKVYRPKISGDSLNIAVVCHDRVSVAHYGPIKLDMVVEDFGNFLETDALLAATVDKNENVYLAMGSSQNVFKFDSTGKRDYNFLGKTNNVLWTDMKMHSDSIYMVRSNNVVYRLYAGGTGDSAVAWLTLTNRNDRIKSIDFDENGNLFGGGVKSDLVLLRIPASNSRKSGFYLNYTITSVRVYEGYIYITAKYSGTGSVDSVGIWRHVINSDGSVGNQELVLDWRITPYVSASINDITFSQDGAMYIGTNDSHAPLVKYKNGELTAVYYDIVSPSLDQMVWGNSTYLYAVINRATRFDAGGQFLRIDIGELGAPYYGRQ